MAKRRAKKRPGLKSRSARVTFMTDRRTVESLEKLRCAGFYGTSRGEVAEYLLKEVLKEMRVLFRKLPR